jgi:agmatinase
MKHHFHYGEIANGDPQDSRFHVIPAPLEKSVSYMGGTQAGPEAILEASGQLELCTGERNPAALGIHTQEAVDASLCSADFLDQLQKQCAYALSCNAVPAVIGGEHSLSFAPIAALAAYLNEPFGIIQFDAHADLRTAYQNNRYSHASVMQRCVEELGLPLFQIAVRAMGEEEHEFRKHHRIGYIDAPRLHRQLRSSNGFDVVQEISSQFHGTFPETVYITFDVDGFDSSFFPATGTPVPGGLFWPETQEMLSRISQNFTIAGFDVVEHSPSHYLRYCDFTAAQLVYDLMGYALKDG